MKMNRTKIITSLLVLITLFGVIAGQSVTYATQNTSFFVGIEKQRNGLIYAINDPTDLTNPGKYIWNLVSFDSASTPTNKELYCVKGGAGNQWNSNDTQKVEYNKGYDIKTERANIKSDLINIADPWKYLEFIEDPTYNKILWITDNMYIPGTGEGKSTAENKEALIKAAGIEYPELFDDDNKPVDYPEEWKMTDDDIEVVQQLALWYYTNNTNNDMHHIEDLTTVQVKDDSLINYISLNNYKTPAGQHRLADMEKLYQYLIEKNVAEENKNSNKYNSTTNELEKPVNVIANNLTVTNGKVGPIKITKNNDLPYTLTFKINGTEVTDTNLFVDVNSNVVDKDNYTGDLYIKTNQTSNVNVTGTINYKTTQTTLWIPGVSKLEQPIIEVKKISHEEPFRGSSSEYKFDLSLRKFITGISNDATFEDADLFTTRVPQVDVKNLKEGKDTAVYTHPKTTLKVKNGDYIEYTIRVYNEGEVDGYAEEITDYILNNRGLQFAKGHETNTLFGWIMYDESGKETDDVTKAVKIKTTHLSKKDLTGTITDPNLITAFDPTKNTLDSRYVKIVFKVTEPNSSKDVTLVNIAEISKAKDKDGNEITEQGTYKDRDSVPGKDNKNPNYPNDKYKTDNLIDNTSDNHEDDIDYEHVIMKKFDLSLVKFISAVSEDETFDKDEYITGTASREPEVLPEWEGTTLKKVNTNKETPVTVKQGDYVLYTIRVYNEGEIDGYASEITDNIPDGLEFVTTNVEFNGIWTVDSTSNKKITTNWLARDNKININSTTGEINEDQAKANGLLKALIKNEDGTVSISKSDPKNPDYRDVQVVLKVTEENTSTRTLVNYAQISKATDEGGNPMNDTGDDIDSTPNNGYSYNEDDEDFDIVVLKCFDLALRKYITAVREDGTIKYLTDNGESGEANSNGKYIRIPEVDTKSLQNGQTATYKHSKTPVKVNKGSNVIYTIRAYNEGTAAGYAAEITDFLPEGLEFVPTSSINIEYGWKMYDKDGKETEKAEEARIVKTTKLADTIIDARKSTGKEEQPYELTSKYVQIECKVKDTVKATEKLTNIAEITKYADEKKNEVKVDADSHSNSLVDETTLDKLPTDSELPTYKDDETGEYIRGQEDDDDFEKIVIAKFDLALRKFITQVNDDEETSRIPQVDATKLISGESTTAEYNHPKTALNVVAGDVITYTIRVYNEGDTAGYAAEVSDDLPEYLTFLPDNDTNKEYGWKMYDKDGKETEEVSNAVKIKTTYLSKEEGEKNTSAQVIDPETGLNINPNLINAFDPSKEVSDTNPDHKEVKVAFKVNADAPAKNEIINKAQVEKNTDPNGDPIDDIDSTPGKWIDGEDDQDIEKLVPSVFDLNLIKFVSQVVVTEDGNTRTTNTGNTGNNNTDIIPKVEINKKKLNSTTVKFVYTIRVANEGDIEGYAKEITDYVPEGLEFIAEDNPEWTEISDGVIATRALENTLLKPGESAPVTVVFTWINGANNLNLKRNWAEISEDYNERGVPDRDSTPGNRKIGEDDIDYADVLLSIKTGAVKTYILLGGAVLIVLASGVILIKKYVL